MKAISLTLLLLCGCAAPHRAAVTSHRHREFCGRPDGMTSEDVYTDSEKGGGIFLGSDPDVQSLRVIHRNQAELGGGSAFSAGHMSDKVDPQDAAIIESAGTAAGKAAAAIGKAVIGAP